MERILHEEGIRRVSLPEKSLLDLVEHWCEGESSSNIGNIILEWLLLLPTAATRVLVRIAQPFSKSLAFQMYALEFVSQLFLHIDLEVGISQIN